MNVQSSITAKAEEARRRTLNNELGDVINLLCEAEDFAEAVFMAAGHLEKAETNAIQRVTQEAQDRIKAAKESLYEIRGDAQ